MDQGSNSAAAPSRPRGSYELRRDLRCIMSARMALSTVQRMRDFMWQRMAPEHLQSQDAVGVGDALLMLAPADALLQRLESSLQEEIDGVIEPPVIDPAAVPQPGAPAVGMPWPLSLEQVRELLQEQRQQLLQDLRQAGVL